MGWTFEVEHSILPKEGTHPIYQQLDRLGPEKEADAECQVQELLDKGLIKPAGGAWSSLVLVPEGHGPKEGRKVAVLHR